MFVSCFVFKGSCSQWLAIAWMHLHKGVYIEHLDHSPLPPTLEINFFLWRTDIWGAQNLYVFITQIDANLRPSFTALFGAICSSASFQPPPPINFHSTYFPQRTPSTSQQLLGLHRILIWPDIWPIFLPDIRPDIRLNSNIEFFLQKKCT